MMYGYDVNGMGAWWMVAAMVVVALAIVGSIWLVVHRPGSSDPRRSNAEETLRDRFAKGELTGDQFDDAMKRLA